MGKQVQKAICVFGVNFMFSQVKALEENIEGALVGDDIEFIHQLRVASRRLRNGLSLFRDCLQGKKIKSWQDQIRKVTRSLGSARDLDIQINLISQLNNTALDEVFKPGYDRLLLRLKQQRAKAQNKVNKTLENLQKNRILDKMHYQLEQMIVDSEDIYFYPPSLYQKAFDAINSLLRDFLNYEQFIWDEVNIEELHAMRIAGKHLRYTLESFAPIYDKALIPHIRAMKEIQDLLGEIHDNDVWISWLPTFIDQEKARIEEFYGHSGSLEVLLPGLHHLIEDRKLTRSEEYHTFLQTWEALHYEKAWDGLKEIIKAPINFEVALSHPSEKTQNNFDRDNAAENDEEYQKKNSENDHEEFLVELTSEDLDPQPESTEDNWPLDPFEETP